MIACTNPLEPDELLLDLPGAPYTTIDCPACRGVGAFVYLHPLYGGADPCTDCMASGEALVEEQGDDK